MAVCLHMNIYCSSSAYINNLHHTWTLTDFKCSHAELSTGHVSRVLDPTNLPSGWFDQWRRKLKEKLKKKCSDIMVGQNIFFSLTWEVTWHTYPYILFKNNFDDFALISRWVWTFGGSPDTHLNSYSPVRWNECTGFLTGDCVHTICPDLLECGKTHCKHISWLFFPHPDEISRISDPTRRSIRPVDNSAIILSMRAYPAIP